MTWQNINDYLDEQDERRMEDIPDGRPSRTIWAMSTLWDNIRPLDKKVDAR